MKEILFDQIVDKIKKYKGLTKKTSEKLVFSLLQNKKELKEFIDLISELENKINFCSKCGFFEENEICLICSNENRNKKIICIVSNVLDAKVIEDTGKFKGVYIIIDGEINLNKNIGPENLKIDRITNMIDEINDDIEIILALNATFEGEVTSNYLYKYLKNKYENLLVTRIAKGIPLGGMIDYMDEQTLESSFINRQK